MADSPEYSASPNRAEVPQASDLPLSIIIPVFNESGTIESCVRDIRAALSGRDHEILIVDDGSTDAEPGWFDTLADRVVRHSVNRGYGAAVKSGIRHATNDILVIIDADGTYPADAIPDLLARLDAFDMVVGDRSQSAESRRNLGPWYRRAAKRLLVATANFLSGTRIPDLNSGLRAFRRSAVEPFLPLIPPGFSLTTTLTLAFLAEGLRIEYIPIAYRARSGKEQSKIRPVRDTLSILLTIVRTVTFFHPLKVFLPLSFILVALGLTILIIGLATNNVLDGTITVLIVSGIQMFVLGLLADMLSRSRR